MIKKVGLSELVEKVGRAPSGMGDVALSFAEKLMTSHFLHSAKKQKIISETDAGRQSPKEIIEQWYDDHPSKRKFASPEFRAKYDASKPKPPII